MKRRGFLGFLSGAIASGPTLVKSMADTTITDAGFGTGALSAAPNMPAMPSAGVAAKVVAWIKKNGVPDWKMQQVQRHADYRRSNGIDPDIACLRSVSSGWKAREQRRRNLERELAYSLASINAEAERRSFQDKLRTKFGAEIGWYE